MKTRSTRHLLLPSLLALAAGHATATDARILPQFGWNARPVVVVAPNGSDARLQLADAWLSAHQSELAQRDVRVVHVVGNRISGLPANDGQLIDTHALRRRLGVADDGFALVLIGKDGGIKQRTNDPAGLTDWPAIIDAMPMRKAGGR